jgi:hypothetical protein
LKTTLLQRPGKIHCHTTNMIVMKYLLISLLAFMLVCSSCKKDNAQSNIIGQWEWTIEYANNPFYNFTPQSTGIRETLIFTAAGKYNLIQNGAIVTTGNYKTATATGNQGQKVLSILYSNTSVIDSAAYYVLINNIDSLIFSHDLIGTAGSGSRHYGRQ